jgi:N-glycosylase/DNA lyase
MQILTRPAYPSGWARLSISPTNLTLANTLPVGQSFLWHRRALPEAGPSEPQEEFSRVIDDPPRVILLRQTPSEIHYTAIHPDPAATREDLAIDRSREWLEDYFQLSRYPDLESLYKDWRERDPGLFGKTELDSRAVGVRVLRQDPWECLVA